MSSARSALLADVKALEPIALPLLDSQGCVLAQDVVAPADVPAFATAECAGFAIRVDDHEPGEVLRVIDDVPAGFRASEALIPGTCIAVTRGAPIPDGADTVVAVAHSRRIEGGVILEAVPHGSCVIGVGALIGIGEKLARAGQLLDPPLIGTLARAGIRSVEVHPRPRVLVVTVGTEYVEPGVPTPTGLVADHLSFLAAALVTEAGGTAFRIPPVLDDLAEVEAVVDDNAHRSDLIVLCGVDPADAPAVADALSLTWTATDDGHVVVHGVRERAAILGFADDPAALHIQARELLPAVLGRLMGREQS